MRCGILFRQLANTPVDEFKTGRLIHGSTSIPCPRSRTSGGITVGNPSDVSQNSGPSGALDADKTNRQNLFLWITQPPCQRFVDLVSARILIFRLLAYPPTKIRCTFTYMREKNYVKTDKLWLHYSALAVDGLDKVCMERGTLQNLYDYAVEKMARVKNKLV